MTYRMEVWWSKYIKFNINTVVNRVYIVVSEVIVVYTLYIQLID